MKLSTSATAAVIVVAAAASSSQLLVSGQNTYPVGGNFTNCDPISYYSPLLSSTTFTTPSTTTPNSILDVPRDEMRQLIMNTHLNVLPYTSDEPDVWDALIAVDGYDDAVTGNRLIKRIYSSPDMVVPAVPYDQGSCQYWNREHMYVVLCFDFVCVGWWSVVVSMPRKRLYHSFCNPPSSFFNIYPSLSLTSQIMQSLIPFCHIHHAPGGRNLSVWEMAGQTIPTFITYVPRTARPMPPEAIYSLERVAPGHPPRVAIRQAMPMPPMIPHGIRSRSCHRRIGGEILPEPCSTWSYVTMETSRGRRI